MEVLRKADKLLKQHKLVQAISEYTTTINRLITSPRITSPPATECDALSSAFNNRGQCHYLQVDFYKAIADYSESLTYNPANTTALYNRAQVKYRLNSFSDAKEDIVRVLELSPDFEDARSCLKSIEHATSNQASPP